MGAVHGDRISARAQFSLLDLAGVACALSGTHAGASSRAGVGSNGVVGYHLYLRGDFIVDGTITAAKMQVGALSAITANLGLVTAGVIQSPNGKFLIDLNNQYEIISD